MSIEDGTNFSQIGLRFKEERERLGFNQTDLGEKLDSSRKTLTNWESGETFPHAKALARFYELGADIMYVITGQRLVTDYLQVIGKEFTVQEAHAEPETVRRFVHGTISQELGYEVSKLALSQEDADALLAIAKRLAGRV